MLRVRVSRSRSRSRVRAVGRGQGSISGLGQKLQHRQTRTLLAAIIVAPLPSARQGLDSVDDNASVASVEEELEGG